MPFIQATTVLHIQIWHFVYSTLSRLGISPFSEHVSLSFFFLLFIFLDFALTLHLINPSVNCSITLFLTFKCQLFMFTFRRNIQHTHTESVLFIWANESNLLIKFANNVFSNGTKKKIHKKKFKCKH